MCRHQATGLTQILPTIAEKHLISILSIEKGTQMTTSASSSQASACGPTFCITRLKTFGRMRCSCIIISFHLMVGGSTSLTCYRGALARVGQGDLRIIQSTCLSSCLESLVRSTTTILKLLTKQTRPKQRLRAQQARRKHQLTPRQPQLSARPLWDSLQQLPASGT